MNFREIGLKVLGKVMKIEKNIAAIEKAVFKATEDTWNEEDNFEDVYKENIYQTAQDIKNGAKLVPIMATIKENKVGWFHPSFDTISNRMNEQDDFIENPFEIEEGVLQCHCGSKRVFSYTKQVRGLDEGTSVFAQCVMCKAKWTERG